MDVKSVTSRFIKTYLLQGKNIQIGSIFLTFVVSLLIFQICAFSTELIKSSFKCQTDGGFPLWVNSWEVLAKTEQCWLTWTKHCH